MPHLMQAAPGAPQAAVERATQVLSAQHPVAHDVASQMQAPPTQR
jgi:hypothetical protein